MRWLSRLRPDRPGPAAAVAEWMEPRLLFSADLAGGLLLAHDATDAGVELRTLGADGEYGPAAAAAAAGPAASQQQGAAASYAATSIAFEANEGQAPAGVDFSAWGSGYGVTLQDGHAAITLATAEGTHQVKLQLVDGATDVHAEGEDLLAARSNSFVGQDASQWRSNIANYGAVRYRDVYDGIDVRYYGNQRQLEYDFIVAAGADAGAIGLRFEGVAGAAIAANGDLVLQVEGSDQELCFRAPLSYQRGPNGALETVASRYEIRADGSIGFVLGNYDRSRELVIDPVLDYATYLGASGGESAVSVATDAAGFVYVTGRTTSGGTPFDGSIGSPGGAADIFVAKLKPDLTLVWGTRIGGSNDEQANAIAVDASGSYIAVTGWSKSGNFPTPGGKDTSLAGLLTRQDAVVVELDGDGAIQWGTFFGGDEVDSGEAVAVDSAGSVYAAGGVINSNLLSGLLSPLLGGLSNENVFVNKYLADGSLAYAQQLGGNGDESATGIALGSGGDVYVVGTTRSGAWAIGEDDLTMNGAQATLSGSADGFLVRLDASGDSASYATFIGGNAADSAAAVAVDGAGKAYVVGETRSGSSFTTSTGAFIESLAGSNRDTGFLRVYDTTQAGSGSLRYSSFIGASGVDHPTGVAIAGSRVVVTGDAGSTDFPRTPDAAQSTNPGTALFLLVLNPLGKGAADLMYGTYYGATATPGGVAVTGNQAVIAGGTSSTGYGTAGTAQQNKSGGQDALIASFTLPNTAPVLAGLVQPGAILEDSNGGLGFPVDALLAGQVLDLDAGAVQGIAITGQDSSNGTWQYSTDGGGAWSAIAGTSVSSALLLAADGQTRIRFVPAANFNGSATLTVRAWDRTAGSAGGRADTSSNGRTTAFSSETQVLNLTVTAVNDPPTNSAVVLTASDEDAVRTITRAELLAHAGDVDGDALTITNLVASSGTLLDLGGGIWSFTPVANDDSAVSFTYDVADGTVTVAGSATLDLLPVNDAPSAVADTVQATLNTPATYSAATLLGNDSDVDSATLTIASVTSISGGTAVLNADGSVTFTPTTGFFGNASFSYRASDGTLQSAATTVTVDINAPPVANGDTVPATEDTPVTYTAAALLGNDTDADGDPLTIASVTSGTGGTAVRNADGTVTFTPNANFNGVAQFSYVASDGRALSAAATVTVNVVAVNDAPVAKPDSFTIDEDEQVNLNQALLLANDTDVDSLHGDLSIVSVGNAVNGSVSLNGNGTFRFTPAANFFGTASFTYVITDGVTQSAPGTVTFTVRPVNDAPVARDDAFVGVEDTPVTFTAADLLANDSDVEGSPLTIVGVSGAGAVLNADGTITFTPPSNLAGPASFKYTVSDGSLTKEARVTIDLAGVNDAPVAAGDNLSAVQDTPVVFTAGQLLGNDTDVDGDVLTVGSVTSGAGGTATLNADGTVTFTPASGFFGNASFTYTARDGSLSSAPVTVTVLVNDVPQASDDTLTASEDTAATYSAADLLGNDVDTIGSPLVIASVGDASGGSVVLNADGTVTFTPLADFEGTASFTYTVSDGTSTSVAATVTIAMVGVNDAPAGSDATLTIGEDQSHAFAVADFGFTDAADGNSLAAVRITSLPTAGTLTLDGAAVTAGTLVSAADIAAGKLVFAPAADANGSGYASFTFQVQDDGGTAGGGIDLDPVAHTITFDVTPVNDAPAGSDATIVVAEDGSHTFAAGDFGFSDLVEGDALAAVRITSLPTAGTLTNNGVAVTAGTLVSLADIVAGKLVFTPAANANGSAYASFTFQVQDDGGTAGGGADLDPTARTITFDVTPVNDAPSGTDKTVTLAEDGFHTFVAADFGFSDLADGNGLAGVHITSLPAAGALTNDGVAVTAGTLVSLADIVAGKLVFMPPANANGTAYASFTFQVQDDGGTAGGGVDLDPVANTVTFDVTPVNDAPAGADKTIPLAEDGSHTFAAADFGFSDAIDGNGLAGVHITSLPTAGTLTNNGVAVTAGTLVSVADLLAGKLVFTPAANANGTAYASFSFQVQDDGGTAGGGQDLDPVANTITLDVTPVNDAPAGSDATILVTEDGSHIFSVADFGFSDAADGHALAAVRVASLPTAGTLTNNGVAVTAGTLVSLADIVAGRLVFTPASNANGSAYASFRFQVQDDGGTAGGGIDLDPVANTITFDVTSVNDAPAGTDKTVTLAEDGSHTFTLADFGFSDAADGNGLAGVRITSVPMAGTLRNDGVAVAAGTLVSRADIVAGKLVFAPAADANGAAYASFTFQVQDDGGTAGGGVDLDPVANTITFDVTPVNDAPDGADKTITLREDTSRTLAFADFGFSDAIDGDSLSGVLITSLPTAGTLTNNGVAVTAGTLVSLADIVAGKLVFTPAANANGSAYASFTFQVQDDGGSAGGGVDVDPVANTITFDVTPVNDAPDGTDKTLTIAEDGSHTFAVADFGFSDAADGDSLAGVRITSLPTAGALTLDGVAVTAGALVSRADIAAGKLVFTPVANANGTAYASFRFQVQDDGGTAGGGIDLDPVANTITFDVTPVNDAPAAGDVTATGNEDAPSITVTLGGTDVEDGSVPTVTLQTLPANGTLYTDAGLTTVAAAGTSYASGAFWFVPAANFNGSTSFAFTVKDSGGLADASPATATINVLAVNDVPVAADVTAGGNEDAVSIPVTLAGTDVEDGTGVTFTLQGLPANGTLYTDAALTTVAVAGTAYASGSFYFVPSANFNGVASFKYTVTDSAGASDATAATATIGVAAVSDAPDGTDNTISLAEDGSHTFTVADFGFSDSADGDSLAAVRITTLPGAGTLTRNGVALAAGTWVSVADIAAGRLVFTPAADGNGAAYASFTFQVRDDGGPAGGGADLDPVANTITLDVTPVNDAPVVTLPAAQAAVEDTALAIPGIRVDDVDGNLATVQLSVGQGTLSVDLAAGAAITAGAPGTGTFTLSGTAAQVNAALATLRYQGATDSNGADALSVLARDASGATGSGTFAITVAAVNDAPVLGDAQLAVAEGGTVVLGTGNFAVGDPDDASFTLDVSTVRGGSFQVFDGAAWTTATRFTSAQLAAGAVRFVDDGDELAPTFDVTVSDAAGAGNTRSATITFTNVNDAPVAAPVTLPAMEEDSGSIVLTPAQLLQGASDVDGPALSVANLVASSGTLLARGDGSWLYTPDADFNGPVAFSYSVGDGLASVAGRARLLVTAVNDAPVITSLDGAPAATVTVAENGTSVVTVIGSDVDDARQDLVYTIAGGADAGLFTIDRATGVLSFVRAADFETPADAGHDNRYEVVVQVSDGRLSGQQSLTIRVADADEPAPEPPPPVTPPPAPPPPADPPAHPVPPAPAPAPAPLPPAPPPAPGHTSQSLQDALGPGGDLPVVPLNSSTLTFTAPVAHLVAEAEAGRILRTIVFDRGGLELISTQGQGELLLSRFGVAAGGEGSRLDDLQRSLRSTAFTGELDRLRQSVREELDLDQSMAVSAVSVSFGLSLVYILWLIRGGVLLGSYLSALPAWRILDPLPVLSRVDEEDESEEEPLHDEGHRGRNTLRGFG